MPKDKLLRIINNKKGDRKSLLKSEKEETKKVFNGQQKVAFLN